MEEILAHELDYEKQTFVELLSEDGIAIFAKGLGLDRLFLQFLKLYSEPHSLVLAINTSPAQEQYFTGCLKEQEVKNLPKSITNEVTSKERDVLYLEGGVVFVTSRILVVDMLKKVCPIDKVAGLLVFNAHRVIDTSSESFIVRLYRQGNKSGFIKGFSDSPEAFMKGFCQLEKIMKNLCVRHAYLWPRFHAVVSSSLQRHKPDVVELRQQMTPNMTAIQLAILDIMKVCLSDLKRANSTLDADTVTVENCLGKSFDQIIKLHLDPIWHQLSYHSKNIISDLKMLRTLLFYLTQYDCVTFYSYLDFLRSSGTTKAFAEKSSWIFMESTNTLFVKSKERVYGDNTIEVKEDQPSPSSHYLEESPKWHLLSMVLEEIYKDCRERTQGGNEGDNEGADTVGGRSQEQEKVLIVTSDNRTSYQVTQYLQLGGKPYLQKQFRKLLASKSDGKDIPKDFQVFLYPKRGRGRPPKAKKPKIDSPFVTSEVGDSEVAAESDFMEFIDEATPLEIFPDECSNFSLLPKPVLLVQSLSSLEDPHQMGGVLNDIRPRTVIMYDADVRLVRQIEVFKAHNPGKPLRVYYLVYDSSVEEQKYLTILRKENEAFQNLIHQKAHMVVAADQEGHNHDNQQSKTTSTESSSSRKAGGQSQEPQTVIVDMREFRSSLPSLLHKQGMKVVPMTIEIGDYILSPDHCVERKSLSDLIGSLNSGRLYNQVKAMTRYYKRPILLIEFEEGKPFSLQSAAISGEVSAGSIGSKLVLLTIHFPKLRILWCSSPHVTAKLFEKIKSNNPQPDPDSTAAVGLDGESTTAAARDDKYNPTIRDCLLKLPGINTRNYRYIMDNVKDFQELVSLSESRLSEILGNDTNGKLLWNGLHRELNQPDTVTGNTTSTERTK